MLSYAEGLPYSSALHPLHAWAPHPMDLSPSQCPLWVIINAGTLGPHRSRIAPRYR